MANFAARTASVTKHDNVTIIESDTQSMSEDNRKDSVAEPDNKMETVKDNDDECVLFDSDLKP